MRRSSPEVNAGSMADIAFLLLIFFLVTTTIEKDEGIARKLPAKNNIDDIYDIKQKNLFSIIINVDNKLLVNDEVVALNKLKERAISFLDNGGYPATSEGYCDYCEGVRAFTSSDNPQKAIVALTPDREADYEVYIAVQNEISKAYYELRDRESMKRYGFLFTEMHKSIEGGHYKGDLEKAKKEMKHIRELYPMIISEAETKKKMRL